MNHNYLNISDDFLFEHNGHHTAKEIELQPQLWKHVHDQIFTEKNQIHAFLSPILGLDDLNIVLTGAGSSAFIGFTVKNSVAKQFEKNTRATPTTTLVTHFQSEIDTDKPVLFISFARSGNSPESTAVIDLAERYCRKSYHIAITCNANGDLANRMGKMENGFSIELPPETEDKGLAMTGSYTSMMLTAFLLPSVVKNQTKTEWVDEVSAAAASVLKNHSGFFKELAEVSFDRIIFLGSGPLLGIAEESHLKVQELCDGIVIGKFDSFLGFRHGPKAIVNKDTILVSLFSSDDYVFQYEKDLTEQIIQGNEVMKVVGVFPDEQKSQSLKTDHNIVLGYKNSHFEGLEYLPYVIPSQLIGFYKSLGLGLQPDNPSESGAISRVVKGVTIYPV